jgi:hypothetical protein
LVHQLYQQGHWYVVVIWKQEDATDPLIKGLKLTLWLYQKVENGRISLHYVSIRITQQREKQSSHWQNGATPDNTPAFYFSSQEKAKAVHPGICLFEESCQAGFGPNEPLHMEREPHLCDIFVLEAHPFSSNGSSL